MKLRRYNSNDIREIIGLFYDTVHTVNAADYTEEQLEAWASGEVDTDAWNRSLLEHVTYVAVEKNESNAAGEIVIGFADMDRSGYLDRLYVHKDHQRQGVASALCDRLEKEIEADRYLTHASITARPFFEKRGYKTVREQQVERNGVLVNGFINTLTKRESHRMNLQKGQAYPRVRSATGEGKEQILLLIRS